MRLKRLGVITVVMAMVLSLAGLASADEASTTTETATAIAPDSEGFSLYEDPSVEPLPVPPLLEFVLYWGFAEFDPPAETPPCYETTVATASEEATLVTAPTYCLNVEGPNGQVNHGSFVSAFVHWLKSDAGMEALAGARYEGHRGNLIKQAAKSDFGKGQWKKDHGIIPTVDTTEALEAADTDGDGPNHAKGHSNPKNPHSGS